MAIITPSFLTALQTGFRKDYQQAYDAARAESQYERLATVVPSTTKSNTYGWLGDFPEFREWVGDRVINDMAAHGYTIENKDFEATVGVKRTDIEDDQIGIYSPMMQHMGQRAAQFPDDLVFQLLADGESELCYDGQNFFDDEHPVYPNADGTGSAVLISNLDVPGADPGAPWYLLDTRNVLKPLIYQSRKSPEFVSMTRSDDEVVFTSNTFRYGVDMRCNVGFGFWQQAYKSRQTLNAENFNAAYAAMASFTADGGRPLGVRPNLLVVPPSLRQAAMEIAQAERLANGATNTNRGVVDVVVSPWLA